MSNADIVLAWKSEDYRDSLPPDVFNSLPANPAGLVELSDADLMDVNAAGTITITTVISIVSIIFSTATSCISCGC